MGTIGDHLDVIVSEVPLQLLRKLSQAHSIVFSELPDGEQANRSYGSSIFACWVWRAWTTSALQKPSPFDDIILIGGQSTGPRAERTARWSSESDLGDTLGHSTFVPRAYQVIWVSKHCVILVCVPIDWMVWTSVDSNMGRSVAVLP